MPERTQESAQETQNGHRLDAHDVASPSGEEERWIQAGDAEEILSRACAEAQAVTAQAHADAEDLLSRAQSRVDLLRAHAEAVRAEAECLRAEAGALRSAARDEVEVATSQAQKLLAAVQDEVDAAGDQFERMRTESLAILRLLRSDVDGGLAGVQQLSGEVQRLSAHADKVGTELRLLLARSVAAGGPEVPVVEPRAATAVRDDVARPRHEEQLAELLGQIWDAASTEASNASARRSSGEPAAPTVADAWIGSEPAAAVEWVDRPVEPPRASQPLIGSGGWGAAEPSLPYTGSLAGEPTPPSASTSRRRRRRRG